MVLLVQFTDTLSVVFCFCHVLLQCFPPKATNDDCEQGKQEEQPERCVKAHHFAAFRILMRCWIEPTLRPMTVAMCCGVLFALTIRINVLSSSDVHRALLLMALLRLRVCFAGFLSAVLILISSPLVGVVLVT